MTDIFHCEKVRMPLTLQKSLLLESGLFICRLRLQLFADLAHLADQLLGDERLALRVTEAACFEATLEEANQSQ